MNDSLEPTPVAEHFCQSSHQDFIEAISCLLRTDSTTLRATLQSGTTTLSAHLRENNVSVGDLLSALGDVPRPGIMDEAQNRRD